MKVILNAGVVEVGDEDFIIDMDRYPDFDIEISKDVYGEGYLDIELHGTDANEGVEVLWTLRELILAEKDVNLVTKRPWTA